MSGLTADTEGSFDPWQYQAGSICVCLSAFLQHKVTHLWPLPYQRQGVGCLLTTSVCQNIGHPPKSGVTWFVCFRSVYGQFV